jgi:hypothetical protein
VTTELSEEGHRTIKELVLMGCGKKREKSKKRNKWSEKKTLLDAGKVRHKTECIKCDLNCEVNWLADIDFWGRDETKRPLYDTDNCPKEDRKKILVRGEEE